MSPRVFCFSILTALLGCFCYGSIDLPVLEYFEAHRMGFPLADFISLIGKYYDFGIGLGLAVWYWRYFCDAIRRRQAVFFTVCWAGCNLAGTLLKFLCGRYRPKMWISQGLYGFHGFGTSHAVSSFPSGHVLDAAAVVSALWILWPRSRPWGVAWVLAMGIARIVVRAHYVSDVLAGALLSFLCVYFINKRFYPEQDGNFSIDSRSLDK